MNPSKIIVTGGAGFIGSNLISRLISDGAHVIGVDNFSSYYSSGMKVARIEKLGLTPHIKDIDLCDKKELINLFRSFQPDIVIHLAAQGGVRASRIQPKPYLEINQIGFLNTLDLCSATGVKSFIFASSSSVYGDSILAPFREDHDLGSPKNLYALSKISNEIIARDFQKLDMSVIGLRFFTVYGPWGRPDMAMFRLIASSILGREFELSASLDVVRDFTFIDDVSNVILELIKIEDWKSKFEIFNVAGGRPHSLRELLQILERNNISIKVKQLGEDLLDVKLTHGSVDKLGLFNLTAPSTTLEEGVKKSIKWFSEMDIKNIDEWFTYSDYR